MSGATKAMVAAALRSFSGGGHDCMTAENTA